MLALLLARLAAGPGLGLYPPAQGRLSADGWDGGWSFEHAGERRALALRHVWHGPAWTTLGFHEPSVGEALQLTVWRSDVSSTGWRRLRQLAARGCKEPRLRITEGQ
ncbi:hypothetical protein [Pusillimonas noertemannii]|uniref:hypothetical protein n=1 Tax=Pusillimonas noertemannii TaxID=305977 RepID=UPI0002E5A71B|nr:hypothetical protein [Pusillimonas noertemannii]